MDSRKMRKNLLDCVTAASFQKEKSEKYRGWRLYYKQTNKQDNNNRNDERNDNNNNNQYRQENS